MYIVLYIILCTLHYVLYSIVYKEYIYILCYILCTKSILYCIFHIEYSEYFVLYTRSNPSCHWLDWWAMPIKAKAE